MFVHANSQFITTLQSSAFKHVPSVGSGHTGSETMYTHSTPDFWLISTFGRHLNYLYKNRFQHPSAIYTPGFSRQTGYYTVSFLFGQTIYEDQKMKYINFNSSLVFRTSTRLLFYAKTKQLLNLQIDYYIVLRRSLFSPAISHVCPAPQYPRPSSRGSNLHRGWWTNGGL